MLRTFVPLALIVLVLLGAWWIWPQPEPRALIDSVQSALEAPAAPSAPAESKVESAATETERSEAGPQATPSATASATRLVVVCVAREGGWPIASVRVGAKYANESGGYGRIGSGRSSTGKPGEELLTDAAGRAIFELEPGRALGVTAGDPEHFVSQEGLERIEPLAAGETREVRLVHEAGEHAHFCGVVVARESGAPLAGAEIQVDEKPRGKTDGAGRFELDFAAHLPPWIRVECQGFAPAYVSAEPGHERADVARRVQLEGEAALVIALQVPEGQALVRVLLRGAGHDLVHEGSFTSAFRALPALKWSADADAQSTCRFEKLPPGVRLDAEVLGSTGVLFRSAEPIVLQPGEQKRLEWDLRGAEIVGHVYEADGKPAGGVPLWLLRGEPGYRRYEFGTQSNDAVGRTTSAEDGSYRFGSVSPGTWILAPQCAALAPGTAPADAIAPVPIEVTLEAGEARRVVDIQLARGLYIGGTLVAPDGTTGVPGYVRAHAATGEFVLANTDPQGRFVLGPLAPGAFEVTGDAYNSYLQSLPVAAEAGARDVVLRARAGAEVSGRVIDAAGAGVQAAITIGGENGSMTMTRTQSDGSFRLDGLEPGRCTLMASTSGGQAGELAGVVLDAAAPLAGLEIVLKPGATLRVHYEGTGVGQLRVRRERATLLGDGLEAGRSLTQVVPPGRIAVEFRFPGVEQPETQEVEIGAGEEREVVFRLPAK